MWLFIFACILMHSTAFVDTENNTLRLVHVFFRHGSETPEETAINPKNPINPEKFTPAYWQLNEKGKQMSYELGKKLRAMYSSFVGNVYTANILESTCTDYDRTKVTALLVSAGLFPPIKINAGGDYVWQPIPYRYTSNKYDYFLRRAHVYCPKLHRMTEEAFLSPEYQEFINEREALLQYISYHTGILNFQDREFSDLYQTLYAEDYMNLTLPKWTEPVFPAGMYEVVLMNRKMDNMNATMKRLNGGRVLKKVVEHMQRHIDGNLSPAGRKLYLYSGHNQNLNRLLESLNVFTPHVPNYSAALIIELHYLDDSRKYTVKVIYAKGENEGDEVMRIPGCEDMCPWNDFLRLLHPHIPGNYTAECESRINLDEVYDEL